MSQFQAIKTFYQGLIDFSSSFQSILLFGMRLFWGYSLLQTGFGKWNAISGIAAFFGKLGIPLPLFNAYLVSCIEMGCGLLLILGLASRLATLPVIIVMCVAYMTAHQSALKGIWDDPSNFIKQEPFTFLLVSLIIFAFGPGRISLDYLIEWRSQGRRA